MSDFDALLLAVLAVLAGGGVLAARGILTITIRKPPPARPVRSPSGHAPPPGGVPSVALPPEAVRLRTRP